MIKFFKYHWRTGRVVSEVNFEDFRGYVCEVIGHADGDLCTMSIFSEPDLRSTQPIAEEQWLAALAQAKDAARRRETRRAIEADARRFGVPVDVLRSSPLQQADKTHIVRVTRTSYLDVEGRSWHRPHSVEPAWLFQPTERRDMSLAPYSVMQVELRCHGAQDFDFIEARQG